MDQYEQEGNIFCIYKIFRDVFINGTGHKQTRMGMVNGMQTWDSNGFQHPLDWHG